METFIGIQHWLYRGIGEGIGSVAAGDYRVVWVAMATAVLFGAVLTLTMSAFRGKADIPSSLANVR